MAKPIIVLADENANTLREGGVPNKTISDYNSESLRLQVAAEECRLDDVFISAIAIGRKTEVLMDTILPNATKAVDIVNDLNKDNADRMRESLRRCGCKDNNSR